MHETRTNLAFGLTVIFAHLIALYFLLLGDAHKHEVKPLPPEVEVSLLAMAPEQSPPPVPTVQVVQHKVSKPVSHAPVLPQVQSATALTAPAQAPVAEPSPAAAPVNEPAPATADVAAKDAPAVAPPPTISSGAEYIRAPQAVYPATARKRGEQGQVVYRVLINEQGQVEKLEIQKSSNVLSLDEAARQAILKAAFKPYILQGKATPAYVIVPISFKLDI